MVHADSTMAADRINSLLDSVCQHKTALIRAIQVQQQVNNGGMIKFGDNDRLVKVGWN